MLTQKGQGICVTLLQVAIDLGDTLATKVLCPFYEVRNADGKAPARLTHSGRLKALEELHWIPVGSDQLCRHIMFDEVCERPFQARVIKITKHRRI